MFGGLAAVSDVSFSVNDGEVVGLGGKNADRPGLDLTGVFVGSEGTLGIVTAAILRILKTPETVKTMLAVFASLEDAGDVVSAIVAAGLVPATLEMMDNTVMRAVEAYPKVKAMVLSDYDLAYELKGKEFPEDDGHAGLIETSRILNLRPELVGKSRPVGKTRPPRFMVVADPERYLPTGVMGDPRGASAGKGGTIDDYVVGSLCALVADSFNIKRKRSRDGG